jgi:hypothetical protein
MTPPTRALRLCWIAIAVLALGAQGIHIWKCANSPVFFFPEVFIDSDMYTTRVWAKSILEQGWTNPEPHHPYTFWMTKIGSRAQWEAWWGGQQIFQQSPLHAYIVAAFLSFSALCADRIHHGASFSKSMGRACGIRNRGCLCTVLRVLVGDPSRSLLVADHGRSDRASVRN